MKFSSKRFLGQGATEYLVLLAVVLIIALVSIALLGFFPGMANDARNTQSQSYWQSAAPIAVVGGSGHISYNGNADSTNGIKLVLRNNGANTVELLGISTDQPNAGTTDPTDFDNYRKYWAYFNAQAAPDGASFCEYVAPPRGTGIGCYTTGITLAPGETVVVGYGIYNGNGGAPYNSKMVCKQQSQEMGKQIELSDLTFYYREKVDGRPGLEKKQYGSKPLVLPCFDADLS